MACLASAHRALSFPSWGLCLSPSMLQGHRHPAGRPISRHNGPANGQSLAEGHPFFHWFHSKHIALLTKTPVAAAFLGREVVCAGEAGKPLGCSFVTIIWSHTVLVQILTLPLKRGNLSQVISLSQTFLIVKTRTIKPLGQSWCED